LSNYLENGEHILIKLNNDMAIEAYSESINLVEDYLVFLTKNSRSKFCLLDFNNYMTLF